MTQPKPKYMKIIDADCDISQAVHFQDDSESRIGHLTKLAFPSLNKELIPDFLLKDPENLECHITSAALLEAMRWEGGSSDPVELRIYLSVQNKPLLQEILVLLTESVEVEIAFVIYEYDLFEKKYFKRFYTNKAPVRLILHEAQIADDSSTYRLKKPRVFEVMMSLIPKEDAQPQEVGFAFSAKGTQFTRQIGS